MFRHSLLACLVIVLSAQAHAAALPFTAFLDLHIGVQVAHLEGTGIAGVSEAGVDLPTSFAATTGAIVPIDASVAAVAFPIAGLQITARNGAGAFLFDSQGGLGGVMPYQGVAKVCLFATCSRAIANVSVPLSVFGNGGTRTVSGVVDVTVVGAPLTTNGTVTGTQTGGPASQMVTAMGFRRGPASNASTYALPGGSIQLVTPVFISTFIGVTPAFAVLGIRFVPEPAALALCAVGIASLAAFARSRRDRS